MFFAKTKPWKFFDSNTAPCCLNWTPTINTVCHPLLTERANTPRRITQPIMTERGSWLWCCLCQCATKCREKIFPPPIYNTNFIFHKWSFMLRGFFHHNNWQHIVIQELFYVNERGRCRKSGWGLLLIKPVANSNMISCQSGLILYSELMAPDKHFTSRLRDQRECAMVSTATQQTHI